MIKPVRDSVMIRPSVADTTMAFNLMQHLISRDDYSGLNSLLRSAIDTEKNPFYSTLLLRGSFSVRFYLKDWASLFHRTQNQFHELGENVAREMQGLYLPVILAEDVC